MKEGLRKLLFKKTTTPEEAARVFSNQYLRPGKPNINKRISSSNNYYNYGGINEYSICSSYSRTITNSRTKELPLERPPEITDPLEALDMHVENITRPQAMKDAFYFLEEGLDMVSLVEGILRSAVMAGRHSIDVSLAIAPALHEYIKNLALDADIEFDEGFEKPDQDKGIQYARDRGKERCLKN